MGRRAVTKPKGEGDEKEQYDLLRHALGDLVDSELGKAALARLARKKKTENAAIDGEAEGLATIETRGKPKGEGDEKEQYDLLRHALGDLVDSELGKAALARLARKKKTENAAIDGEAEGLATIETRGNAEHAKSQSKSEGKRRKISERAASAVQPPKPADRHVRLYHRDLETPAFRSLNCYARALLIEFQRAYNGSNNGQIILPVKEAMRQLGIGSTHTMLRAFQQLEERGWIIATSRGAFTGGAKNATKWELTSWPLVKGAEPKRLFRKWQHRLY